MLRRRIPASSPLAAARRFQWQPPLHPLQLPAPALAVLCVVLAIVALAEWYISPGILASPRVREHNLRRTGHLSAAVISWCVWRCAVTDPGVVEPCCAPRLDGGACASCDAKEACRVCGACRPRPGNHHCRRCDARRHRVRLECPDALATRRPAGVHRGFRPPLWDSRVLHRCEECARLQRAPRRRRRRPRAPRLCRLFSSRPGA